MKYLIVGNSAAGLFAAEEIRRRDNINQITIITADMYPSYSRCLTTYFLAGDIPETKLYLRKPDYFIGRNNFNILYNTKLTQIRPEKKIITSGDTREWSYDKLLLATGSSAVHLQTEGSDLPGIFSLRHLEDALKINGRLEKGKKAVIIGGGLVSLKSAYALLKRELEVTVVVASQQLLSQMLNQEAADLLQNHLENHGLRVIFGQEVKAFTGQKQVETVILSDGQELPADLVIIGKGVKPNTEFLQETISQGLGIRVNSYMETAFPDVYAAGDVAETWDCVSENYRVNATWPNAATQGRLAGANMAGARESYHGSMGLNSVDFFGLSAISAGISKLKATELSGEWQIDRHLKIRQDGFPIYQQLIWKSDVLKGYMLVGDITRAGILTSLVREGKPLKENQRENLISKRNIFNAGIQIGTRR